MKTEARARVDRLNAYMVAQGWTSRKSAERGSPSELERRLPKGSSFWSDLLRGDKSFSADLAREIEEAFGLEKYYLDNDHGIDPFVAVERVNVRVSAGPGAHPEVVEADGALQFRRDFLMSCGASSASAKIVTVTGTSMEPTITDGAVLLINIANKEPKNNAIYALATSDGLLVKRLIRVGEAWIARSDNPDGNPDRPLEDGDRVIGRAVWMGAKL
ncbi:S24 family peptidase [Xenophilus sp. Marseille-Q4582]|uniref:S24 family peptidase n=1 Tax=Xenophilus sp. Marseille-Q4582 TaxID=2866600 RepID=UPI001CE44D24|nr:S24 family peptidase [Xenophilus sp. Marseille-Q4582]